MSAPEIKAENNTSEEIKEPGRYTLLLHNDNYTTMDFVVEILKEVFHKSPIDANKIMLDIHQKGKGTVATYTYDIAATKVYQVEHRAGQAGFPLRCTMEKE